MKKLSLFITMTLIISMMTGAIVQASQNDNAQGVSFSEQVSQIQTDNALDDNSRLTRLTELFINMKHSDYKQEDNVSYAGIESKKNKNFSKYFVEKQKLFKQMRKNAKVDIIWDDSIVNINNIEIDGDNATVEAIDNYKYKINNSDNIASVNETNYTITFTKEKGNWLISSVRTDDEFDQAYYGTEINAETIINEMNNSYVDPDIIKKNEELKKQAEEGIKSQSSLAAALTYVSYDRSRAGDYARSYSCSDHTNTAASAYNQNFPNYAPSDCQNFASQCIWYGLGGTNSTTAINGKYFPMITTTGREWYQTGTKYGNSSSWTSCGSFKNYIEASSTSVPGPYGYTVTSSIGLAEVGDTIQIYNSTDGWYHTYVVDYVEGTAGSRTKSNIWVCAHTSNRQHERLDLVTTTTVANMRNLRIFGAYRN